MKMSNTVGISFIILKNLDDFEFSLDFNERCLLYTSDAADE